MSGKNIMIAGWLVLGAWFVGAYLGLAGFVGYGGYGLLLSSLVAGLGFGLVVGGIAIKNGRSFWGWFIFAFIGGAAWLLLGLVAVAAVTLMEPKNEPQEEQPTSA